MPGGHSALAKLSPPRLHPDVLARTRLYALLDEATQRPVVWLHAPPGAGKTTLVAGWLVARQRPVLWYQVDDGDADAASFVYYLKTAAEALGGKASTPALPLLTPEYQRDLRGFARRFFRLLFARLVPGSVLVLDNFQEVLEDEQGAAFQRMVSEAMAQLPAGVTLLVISRSEPSAAYAPQLADGLLSLVDGPSLRMNAEETGYIARQRGVAAEAAIASLHERSQGWAAGLTLLLARGPQQAEAAASGDDAEALQHVFSYFAQRVFDAATTEQQQALMQLSVLPPFSAALAQQLTGQADVGRQLEAYHRRQLFTDRRRANGLAVYQFHALFQSFLAHQARQRLGDAGWRDLRGRAGRLLASIGQHEAALPLLAEAADWPGCAEALLAQAERLLEQGRQQTLAEALARLPDVHFLSYPWLGYWAGRALMFAAPDRAVQRLQSARERFAADADVAGQLACGAAIIQTLWYARLGWSEIQPLVDGLAALIEQPDALPPFPSPAVELMTWSALHAALAFCRLAHPAIRPLSRQLLALIDDEAIDWNQRLSTATHLMTWFHNASEFELCQQLMHKIDPQVERRPSSALNRSFWFTFRAIHDMRAGRDDEAAQGYQHAEDLARDEGLLHAEFAALQFHAYLEILFRRAGAASLRLHRMEQHPARSHADADMNHCTSLALLAQLQQRPAAEVLAAAQRALQAVDRVGAPYFHAVFKTSLASAFADGGDAATARALLAQARGLATGSYLEPMLALLLLEEAYVAQVEGDAALTALKLEAGLRLAAADPIQASYIHRILSRKPQLLVEALQRGIEPELVRLMIQRWQVPPPDQSLATWPWAVQMFTLGGFSLRVHGAPLVFGRKAPKKTLALLKAIVARGGSVADAVLVDQFWPDQEGDAAAKSLAAALHRLRALLGVGEALVQQGGQLSLDRSLVWVDAWAFEQALEQAPPARQNSVTPQPVIDALAMYRGAFLPDDEGESWPVATRERLRGRYVRAVAEHAARLETAQQMEEAIAWYLSGLDADPLIEPFYQGLMRCYHRLDRLPEAAGAYRRLKQTLAAQLSLPPSAGTERLAQSLRLA